MIVLSLFQMNQSLIKSNSSYKYPYEYHSHVSLLIDMGFSAHLIAERIGDTVQMVNNTYGHLYPTKHKEVADKLNNLIVSN